MTAVMSVAISIAVAVTVSISVTVSGTPAVMTALILSGGNIVGGGGVVAVKQHAMSFSVEVESTAVVFAGREVFKLLAGEHHTEVVIHYISPLLGTRFKVALISAARQSLALDLTYSGQIYVDDLSVIVKIHSHTVSDISVFVRIAVLLHCAL